MQVVLKVAKWHDDLLAAKDPVLTLRLGGRALPAGATEQHIQVLMPACTKLTSN